MNPIVLVTGAGAGLSEVEAMILAESAGEKHAFNTIPTKITIAPGGIGAFATQDGETMKSITGVVAISQIARAYWPEKSSKRPPLCSSPDGVLGVLNQKPEQDQVSAAANATTPHEAIRLFDAGDAVPPTFSCAACPMAQWGSAHQGGKASNSQACKELRRLVVLVDGWTQPALLTLPPTSVKTWDAFCSAQQRNRSAYWAVRIKVGLDKQNSQGGDAYSTVVIEPVERLTDKTILQAVVRIREEYAKLVREMSITGDEYRTTGDGDVVDGTATVGEAQPFL